ncbi:Protein PLANT CADMIUM RESISTANCE 3 [Thelohanellus kitauei]|uniref:Protein PLANT CADMIUM RESISTANCE 3 n=1 Tax=Thelohanellus kitauei TaxID=669202 RepID=A0A0C2J9L5_THEKT|nr:Protein PLANT CADMIUM RESISTANCE 3 [Thelohanellus kitauei]
MADFKQDLCGCFSNMESCLCAWCCPCISSAYIAEKTGDNFLLILLLWFVFPLGPPIYLRNKIRMMKNIEGSILEDILVGCCCDCCVLSQLHTEMDVQIIR